ncbi:MAG TPA: glucose-6-phosphate dehydrogenase assembly protein OpcA [Thermoanaerobaculia bacterium]|nr:glucose-6-phosphate dehydrogenase assembly protein OpcA [Thermoanaerobaculia bacterium]
MVSDDEVRVDVASIEKQLSDLWRTEKQDGDNAVTRAALWNVVAHTWDPRSQSHASETLSRASASVPQRTIVVRSMPEAENEIASWISANCHLIGGGKQMCSEEIAITAGGSRIHHVPPLVNALLIPDMPVAVWWVGDLPNEHEEYVESLLEPADRIIVDSSQFDRPADLALLRRIGSRTTTVPADLTWVRLEEWRAATASIFDPPRMRARLRTIRKVRVVSGGELRAFGDSVEALLFAAWLSAQLEHRVDDSGKVESSTGTIDYELVGGGATARGVASVEIRFDDDTTATIARDRERGVVVATTDETSLGVDCVTRVLASDIQDLIVRQLKRPEGDRIFVKALPIATRLAARVAA